MNQPARDAYREFTRWLRRANNRRVGRRGSSFLPRPQAGIGDFVRALQEGHPFAAGKIGGAELMAMEYLDHRIRPAWPPEWSWRRPARRLMNNAGFFPLQKEAYRRWHRTMVQAVARMDFLSAWQTDPFLRSYEERIIRDLAPASRDMAIENLGRPILPDLLPFRWLVVSPFVLSIRRQLPRLRQVHDPQGRHEGEWSRPAATCQLVRCPFQSHLEPSPYPSWQEGLERLAAEISSLQFDVALIGAGAWSLPLAAQIKVMGRSAIHLGGETQLLFGIKGKRWENYGIFNEAWISADASEMPAHRDRVENGCYW